MKTTRNHFAAVFSGGYNLASQWRQFQLRLVVTSRGRLALHLLCLVRDGRVGWHMRGIRRELEQISVRLHSSLSAPNPVS